jgi:tetratricopeptide (TPR) repeat protein/tRNA A-37 threonylcarbamoyl transferase component Bud32
MTKLWYPGDKFPNGWEINNIIDSGGMGTVYIVENPAYEYPLAAKTFKQQFFSHPSTIQRFYREAETWVQLGNHNHIVTAEFVEKIEGKPYIFLEYVPGPNLRELLCKQLDLQKALAFAIQFCDGMTYVHEIEFESGDKGLVHCDIKPENILISVGDTLKITDFGLARSLSGNPDIALEEDVPEEKASIVKSRAGVIIGTPPYMSPEHFAGPNAINKLSDIYSFGVVLFEMLTGERPFKGEGRLREECIDSFRYQHLHAIPPTPRSLNQSIPKELESLVLVCLEKNPHERPPDFATLREELMQIYNQLTGKAIQLVDMSPEHNEVEKNYRLAKSYYNLGKPKESIEWCIRALALAPDSEEVLNTEGLAYLELDEYQEALQRFDRILSLNPGSTNAWNNKASVYSELEDYQQALYCCKQCLHYDPDYWQAFHNMGAALDNLNRCEEALDCFKHALDINPLHVNSWASMGNVMLKLERYDEALACEGKALSINPRNTYAVNNVVVIHLRLGRHKEALQWADRLIEIDPRFPPSWFNKACIFLDMNRYDTAVETIEEGLNISPWRVEMLGLKLHILKEIASIRATPADLRRVYDCVNEVLDLDPGNENVRAVKNAIDMTTFGNAPGSKESDEEKAKSLNSQGENLLNMMGDFNGAIKCFQQAIDLNPGYMDPYNNIGVSLELQGKIDEAIKYYDKASELAPDFYMPWYNKGNCYKTQHNYKNALKCYNKAIKLNPGFVNNWINKGAVLLGLKRVQEALKCLEKALQLDPDNPFALNGKAYCEKFL